MVCIAIDVEFDSLKNETNSVLLTESSLENKEVCLAFCPREWGVLFTDTSDVDNLIELLINISRQIWEDPDYERKPYSGQLFKKIENKYSWEIRYIRASDKI